MRDYRMALLAGVDGGATKTVAVVGSPDGTLLGIGRSSSSNYHNVGVDGAADAIRVAVGLACRRARVSVSDLETIVLGLAAMDSPKDYVAGRRVADLTSLGKRRIVKHDSLAALYAATLGRPGIVVNAGTGSFAIGINAHGETLRVGGRGAVIDDEGSAYDTARLGIRAALRAQEGSERRTAIAGLLVRRFKLRNLEDIIYRIYQKPMTVGDIANISTLVTGAALRGDIVARKICAYEARALAVLVSTVARRLHMTRGKPDVYLTGGLFKAGPLILNPFKRELQKRIRSFTVRRPEFEPVVGALMLSLKEHQVEASGKILLNLRASYGRCLAGRRVSS
jgi:glucosamine kinase